MNINNRSPISSNGSWCLAARCFVSLIRCKFDPEPCLGSAFSSLALLPGQSEMCSHEEIWCELRLASQSFWCTMNHCLKWFNITIRLSLRSKTNGYTCFQKGPKDYTQGYFFVSEARVSAGTHRGCVKLMSTFGGVRKSRRHNVTIVTIRLKQLVGSVGSIPQPLTALTALTSELKRLPCQQLSNDAKAGISFFLKSSSWRGNIIKSKTSLVFCLPVLLEVHVMENQKEAEVSAKVCWLEVSWIHQLGMRWERSLLPKLRLSFLQDRSPRRTFTCVDLERSGLCL